MSQWPWAGNNAELRREENNKLIEANKKTKLTSLGEEKKEIKPPKEVSPAERPVREVRDTPTGFIGGPGSIADKPRQRQKDIKKETDKY